MGEQVNLLVSPRRRKDDGRAIVVSCAHGRPAKERIPQCQKGRELESYVLHEGTGKPIPRLLERYEQVFRLRLEGDLFTAKSPDQKIPPVQEMRPEESAVVVVELEGLVG